MFANRRHDTRRSIPFAGAVLVHALALAAVLASSGTETKAPVKPEKPIVLVREAAPKLGGGSKRRTSPPAEARRRLQDAPAPEIVTPSIIPTETPAETDEMPDAVDTLAEAAGDEPGEGTGGPGVPWGHGQSDCVENCTGAVPGSNQPYPGDVEALGIVPVPLYQPQPQYPASARMAGLTGTVLLEIIVEPDGTVRQARVVKSQPPFDQAALVAVRTWRYQPVFVSGRPIVWKSTIQLRFQLH